MTSYGLFLKEMRKSKETMMLTFVSPLALTTSLTSPFVSKIGIANQNRARFSYSKRRQAKKFAPRCTVDTSPPRAEVMKDGIDAAVEDYVKSGMNICIGNGKEDDLTMLMNSLDSLNQLEGLVDVAFVCTSATTKAMLEERDLPSDLSVNFKRTIDVFIAPITAMDESCNAVLDSDNIAADRYAAQMAEKTVFIVHEGDVKRCKSGLPSVPVQLVSFLPDLAVESLCSGVLLELGVRGATLRADESAIADLSLAPGVMPQVLEHELNRLPQVIAPGFLPATEKTIAVVATRDLQPIDMTSSLHSMASLSEESRKVALTGEKREDMLATQAKSWALVAYEDSEVLSREFKFKNVESAEAFVRYVHYVSGGTGHCPEIKHASVQVEVSLMTEGATGVTELDALVSKELALVYDRMQATSQTVF